MRKDVECTFGIMKGRFRILKTGIRLHGTIPTDRIWLTCCALHNLLLDADGLAREWENGVPSDWEGEMGEHNSSDVSKFAPNFAVRRLNNPQLRRNYDTSGMGVGSDREEDGDDQSEDEGISDDRSDERNYNDRRSENQTVVRKVSDLSFHFFRDRLVEHFDILFQQNKIRWPTRMNEDPPRSCNN